LFGRKRLLKAQQRDAIEIAATTKIVRGFLVWLTPKSSGRIEKANLLTRFAPSVEE
jgi:hypothetical protein